MDQQLPQRDARPCGFFYTKTMKFILGVKQHMTQVFDEEGRVRAATVITTGPIIVSQVKTKETDGYEAVQVAYGEKKASSGNKAQLGHGKGKVYEAVREFTNGGNADMKVGDSVNASIFNVGDVVEVSGISKGKGFQGVVKRYGFKGGQRTHGQKHSEREPGSIGGGLRNRVPKGMRMGGRMGSDRVTVKNLSVVAVDAETNTLYVSGAVPGRRGTLVEIRSK